MLFMKNFGSILVTILLNLFNFCGLFTYLNRPKVFRMKLSARTVMLLIDLKFMFNSNFIRY